MQQNFFEKYQTFFSIIIAGALIAGGIVLAKTVPSNNAPGAPSAETEQSVKKDLLATARKIGVDQRRVEACLDDGTHESTIQQAMTIADQTGITGTPTFVIIKRTFGPADELVSEKQWSIIGARDQATILQSIAEEKPPADQPDILSNNIELTGDDHYRGNLRAEIVIVEYADVDCEYCKRAKPVIDQIFAEHPEYAFVYRHSPILSRHPFAGYKAEAAECVADIAGEEKFWEFMDIISS